MFASVSSVWINRIICEVVLVCISVIVFVCIGLVVFIKHFSQ